MKSTKRTGQGKLARLLAILTVVALFAAACGSDDSSDVAAETTAAPSGDDTSSDAPMVTSQAPGECGAGTGEAATGDPIKLGGIATNTPDLPFWWITGMASLYFDCVNANGGIHGRPIEYITYEEQVDPAQVESLGVKLVEEDKVLGIVGSTSVIECGINGDYYAENGYHPIIAGVDPTCFLSPNWSAVNMGPYYSNLGAAQAALRAGATGKIVVVSPDQPGMDFNNQSVIDFAEANGLEGVGLLEAAPFAEPAGLAQRLVAEAGPGGAVVLNYGGPLVVPLLEAIDQQGLIDDVIWASSTPPNDPTVAQALSSNWDGKFLINAEFNVIQSTEPDQAHMNEIHAAASPDFPPSAFTQMGYLVGRMTTDALLGIDGDITKESVNDAIFAIDNFESDMLCTPWYYDSGVADGNVANNSDRTVSPQGDQMVQVEDCFEIAALDSNPLGAIRAARG